MRFDFELQPIKFYAVSDSEPTVTAYPIAFGSRWKALVAGLASHLDWPPECFSTCDCWWGGESFQEKSIDVVMFGNTIIGAIDRPISLEDWAEIVLLETLRVKAEKIA